MVEYNLYFGYKKDYGCCTKCGYWGYKRCSNCDKDDVSYWKPAMCPSKPIAGRQVPDKFFINDKGCAIPLYMEIENNDI